MRIADITSADTGGQSYKLSKAITSLGHEDRSFISVVDYLKYPYDILKSNVIKAKAKKFVRQYLASVDIVHLHNKYRNLNGWGIINKDAKYLIHQHGRFPTNVDINEIYKADEIRNAYRVVSTLNLIKYVNNDYEKWIPAPFDIDYFTTLKLKNYKPSEKIRIAHSPTNRTYKNTDLVIQICNEIQDVELVLIEKMTNAESLRLRSTCDITFDQMHLCYGNSGLEGMCFGQPTIVGMGDDTRNHINTYIGYEPFIYATPETLKEVIISLLDKDLRKKYSEISLKYVNDYHDHIKVAKRVLNIYNKL